jgi:hypothetical protein
VSGSRLVRLAGRAAVPSAAVDALTWPPIWEAESTSSGHFGLVHPIPLQRPIHAGLRPLAASASESNRGVLATVCLARH